MNQRTLGLVLIALGIAAPSLYLGLSVPGDNYQDESALSALFPWFFIVFPAGLAALIAGLYKYFRSDK